MIVIGALFLAGLAFVLAVSGQFNTAQMLVNAQAGALVGAGWCIGWWLGRRGVKQPGQTPTPTGSPQA